MRSIIDNILNAHYKKKHVYSEGNNEELKKINFFADILGENNLTLINERLADATLMTTNKDMLRQCYVNVEKLPDTCLTAFRSYCMRLLPERSNNAHQVLSRPVTDFIEKLRPWGNSPAMRILVGCPGVGKSTFLYYFFDYYEKYFSENDIAVIIMDLHAISDGDIHFLYQSIYRVLQLKKLTSSDIANPTAHQVVNEIISVVANRKLIIVFDNIDKCESFNGETALLKEILKISSELREQQNVKIIVSIRKITVHLHSHNELFSRMRLHYDYIPAPPINIVLINKMSYIMADIRIEYRSIRYEIPSIRPDAVSITVTENHKKIFEYLPRTMDTEINEYLYHLSNGNIRSNSR